MAKVTCPFCQRDYMTRNDGRLRAHSGCRGSLMEVFARPGPPKDYTRKYHADPERTQAMVALAREGYTLAEIGERYNLTRERVRQLLAPFGGVKKLNPWRASGYTDVQVRRFFRGIGRLAWHINKNRHGTASRYQGSWIYPPCRCDVCKQGNRERCYANTYRDNGGKPYFPEYMTNRRKTHTRGPKGGMVRKNIGAAP